MVFDAHADIFWDVARRRNEGEDHVLEKYHKERLTKGQVEGVGFSIWANPEKEGDTYAGLTENMILQAKADIAQSTDWLAMVRTPEEALKAKAEGKIYGFVTVEGMAAVGKDLSKIDTYYADFGARMGMLTWNEKNDLATGCKGGPADEGLTDLGKEAIRIMEDRKILADVSHLNDGGFWDIIKMATKPVIATHSNCRCMCDHVRNLTDDMMRAIKETGGVVGLNCYHNFISADPAKQNAAYLAQHAAHMAEVMGVEHVICGFDFCEFLGRDPHLLEGLEDASHLPSFMDELRKVGFSEKEVNMIGHENMLRVLG
ncbi:MAG: membrane dipeptidase [Oscillospiraceae bacterium]|nr:membrane dipeptidase [Oscillospiraceae bacterium]